jgi:hypothetical protein
MVDTIDFGDTSAVQTRGKAAKKAAKKAQQARWLDSGDEGGAKDGDEGDGDGGNAGGGDGGSGGGGNDGGGGGGGDDNNDDWDFGGKKNKKNKKSKKQEEEEKKKQEEEEQKKKEEEDAAAAAAASNGGNFLNWADDANEANMDDDWTGFTATKSKDKKKRGKKASFTLYIIRFISDFMYRTRMPQLLLLQMHMQLQRSTK